MVLIVSGMIATGLDKCPGQLLLTEKAIFVVKPTINETGATALFGVLGLLVVKLYGKAIAPEGGPGYLSDPDLAELSERERKNLNDTEILVKYAISPSLKVTPKPMGFSFEDGLTGTKITGLIFKKKIAAFLHERGIQLQGT